MPGHDNKPSTGATSTSSAGGPGKLVANQSSWWIPVTGLPSCSCRYQFYWCRSDVASKDWLLGTSSEAPFSDQKVHLG